MTENEILNIGLDLAMEWGEDWLKPIQKRLSKKYVGLTPEQLEEYNNICQATMNAGNDFIYKKLEKLGYEKMKISQKNLRADLTTYIHKKYSWVNDKNISRLYSQGCYYAWKDGLTDSLE